MGARIVDGEGWIRERLKFLREQLAGDPSDEERRAMETEIEALSRERGIMPAGLRFPRLLRRLRRR
ncbi:MAG TPA: hypothetical protein VFS16_12085 [Acidimicrobiia bacterium]|nr:hypothetical protein [Acidimicrobiia bacterium]